MLYRNILSQARKITWHNKYLWFFGLFAALLGNGGELEIIFRSFDGNMANGFLSGWPYLPEGFFSTETFYNIGRLLVNDPLSLLLSLAIMLILIFLVCFLIWLIIVSQIAIVNNAGRSIGGKKHDFRGGLTVGMKKFWPVLGLNAARQLIVYVLLALMGLFIIIGLSRTQIIISFVISFLFLVPLAIIWSWIIKYAIAYVVIKNNRFLEALRYGWQLFTANWLVTIEMAFILLFINFFVGLCLAFLFLVLVVPFLFLAFIFIKLQLVLNLVILAILAVILLLVITVLTGSGLATFQISSWTGLFLELVNRGGTSKIVRLFSRRK